MKNRLVMYSTIVVLALSGYLLSCPLVYHLGLRENTPFIGKYYRPWSFIVDYTPLSRALLSMSRFFGCGIHFELGHQFRVMARDLQSGKWKQPRLP